MFTVRSARRTTGRATTLAAGALGALALLTAPAQAGNGPTVTKGTMDFPASWAPAANCEGDVTIGLGLHVDYTEHVWTDTSGEPVRESKNMHYVGSFENLTTGEQVEVVRGARTVTVDLIEGTLTSRGNYRTVTVAGEGAVFKWAGREVYDMTTWEQVEAAGPQFDELSPGGDAIVCGLFGLEAESAVD